MLILLFVINTANIHVMDHCSQQTHWQISLHKLQDWINISYVDT